MYRFINEIKQNRKGKSLIKQCKNIEFLIIEAIRKK